MNTSTRTQDATLHPRIGNGRYTEAGRLDPGELELAGERFDWLDDAELLRVTRQAAKSASAKWYGAVDPDEIQAETVLALMERRKKMEDASAEATADAPITVPVGSSEEYLAKFISRNVATKLYLQVKTTDDAKGFRKYKDAVSEFGRINGRMAKSSEQDAMAETIRISFPVHHRPTIGFHRSQVRRPVSLDDYLTTNESAGTSGAENGAHGAQFATVDRHSHDGDAGNYDVGSYGDKALTAFEANPRDIEVKANAYCALAETRDAPMPARNCMTEADATKCRKLIAAAGGIKQVAFRARDGELTKAEMAAFLMPFPGLHPDRAEDVANVMLSHPAYTEDLWGSTLKFSTLRAPRKRLAK